MAVNILEARKQGFKDDEILTVLQTDYPDVNVQKAYDSGFTLEEIVSEIETPDTAPDPSPAVKPDTAPDPSPAVKPAHVADDRTPAEVLREIQPDVKDPSIPEKPRTAADVLRALHPEKANVYDVPVMEETKTKDALQKSVGFISEDISEQIIGINDLDKDIDAKSKTIQTPEDVKAINELINTRNEAVKDLQSRSKELEQKAAEYDAIIAKEVQAAKKKPTYQKAKEILISAASVPQLAGGTMPGLVADAYIATNNKVNTLINAVAGGLTGKKLLKDDYQIPEKVRDKLYNNFFTESAKQNQEKNDFFEKRWQGKNLFDVAKDEGAAGAAAYTIANSLASTPQMLAVVVLSAVGVPPQVTMGLIAAMSATSDQQKFRDNIDTEAPSQEYDKNTIRNVLVGASEGLAEAIGTIPFTKSVQLMLKTGGREVAEQAVKGWARTFLKTVGKSVLHEGPLEEGSSALATVIIDQVTGVDPKTNREAIQSVIENIIIGSTSALGMGTAAGIQTGHAAQVQTDIQTDIQADKHRLTSLIKNLHEEQQAMADDFTASEKPMTKRGIQEVKAESQDQGEAPHQESAVKEITEGIYEPQVEPEPEDAKARSPRQDQGEAPHQESAVKEIAEGIYEPQVEPEPEEAKARSPRQDQGEAPNQESARQVQSTTAEPGSKRGLEDKPATSSSYADLVREARRLDIPAFKTMGRDAGKLADGWTEERIKKAVDAKRKLLASEQVEKAPEAQKLYKASGDEDVDDLGSILEKESTKEFKVKKEKASTIEEKFADWMAKKLGSRVVWFDTDSDFSPDGISNVAGKKGRIYINKKRNRGAVTVAFHEAWHDIGSKDRTNIMNASREYISEEGEKAFKDFYVNQFAKKEDGEAAWKGLKARGQRDELIAAYIESQVDNPDFWKAMAKRDKASVRKLALSLGAVVQKVRNAKPAKGAQMYVQNIEKMNDLIASGLIEKGEGVETTANVGTFNPEQDDIRFKRKKQPTVDERKEAAIQLQRAERQAREKLLHAPDTWIKERARLGADLMRFREQKIDEVKKGIYQYGRQIGLHKETFNRVDTLIKNAKTVRDMEKALDYMDRTLEARATRAMVKKVEALIKKKQKYIDELPKKPKSKMDYESNKRLQDYLNEITIASDKQIQNANQLLQDLADDPNTELTAAQQRAISAIGRTSIKSMSLRQLTQVVRDIKDIEDMGRLRHEQREAEFAAKVDDVARKAVPEISKGQPEIEPSRRMNEYLERIRAKKENRGKTSKWVKDFLWKNIRAEIILEWFNNWKRGPLVRETFDKVKNATEQESRMFKQDIDFFRETHAGLAPAKDIAVRKVTIRVEAVDEDGNTREYKDKFSLDEMKFVYALSQNPNGMRHLKGQFEEGGDGLPEMVIEKIVDTLPDEHKRAVDMMIDYYDTVVYDRLNEAFREMFGINMPKEHRYFPILKVATDRAENLIVSDFLARHSSKPAGVERGMTKQRGKSKAPFDRMSYYEAIIESLLATNHFAAFGNTIKEVNAVLNHKEIKKAMERRNETAYNEVKAWLKRNAYGKIGQPGGFAAGLAQNLRMSYIPAVLGGNLMTMLKQATSLSLGMDQLENKSQSMVKAIATILSNPRKMRKFINNMSTFMADRRNSFQREFQEMAEKNFLPRILGADGLKGKSKQFIEGFKQFSMEGIKQIDGLTVDLLWTARYSEVMEKTGGNEPAAIDAADRLIRKTQPVGGVLNLPSSFTGNALERTYTMFMNQPNQNLNLMFEMASRWGEEKTTRNAGKVFWRIAVPSFIFYTMSNAFQPPWKDPEGWGKEALRQMIGGIPILGQLMVGAADAGLGAIRKARGGKRRMDRFAGDFSPSAFGLLEDIIYVSRDPSTSRLAETAAKFKGLPTVAYRRAQNAYEMGDARYLVFSRQALKRKDIIEDIARKRMAGGDERKEAMKWIMKQDAATRKKVFDRMKLIRWEKKQSAKRRREKMRK